MDMVCGRRAQETVTYTKASTTLTKSMAMVFLLGHLATCTRVITWKICVAISDRCIGVMEVTTRVSGRMAFKMEKVLVNLLRNIVCSRIANQKGKIRK